MAVALTRTQTPRLRGRLQEPQAAKMSYRHLLKTVDDKLPRGLLEVWKRIVQDSPETGRFWGRDKRQGWIPRLVTLAVYRDLTNHGYQKALDEYNIDVSMTHKSFEHNTQVIREILGGWAREWIVNDGEGVWNDSKGMFGGKGGLFKVNLVMDSTDFPLAGRRSCSRKSPRWSYKLKGPGQRYQVIFDARGVAQGVWGGCSPKMYDGDAIKLLKDYLALHFSGAHIAADTHYETCNKTMAIISAQDDVKFYTTISKPRGRKAKKKRTNDSTPNDDPLKGATKLNKQQEEWNSALSVIRARVESPFGIIKRRWASLAEPFRESEEQQDYLVSIALATENFRIDNQ